MIFWFAGFIALGALLPPPRACHGSVCSSLQAATVFGAFEWYLPSLFIEDMNWLTKFDQATVCDYNCIHDSSRATVEE